MVIANDRRESCKSEISPNLLFGEKYQPNKDIISKSSKRIHLCVRRNFR